MSDACTVPDAGPSDQTAAQSTREFQPSFVTAFRALFDGRRDAHGADLGRRVDAPVDDALILAHLTGQRRIGIYTIAGPRRDMVKWSCIDIDQDDFELAVLVQRRLGHYAIPSSIERSKGKGWHVWVFLLSWIEAWKVRAVVRLAIADLGDRVPGPLEVFPKQDVVPEGGYGNYVNLPLFGGDVLAGRTCFHVEHEGKPKLVADWVPSHAAFAEERTFDEVVDCHGLKRISRSAPRSEEAGGRTQPERRVFDDLLPCATRMLNDGAAEGARNERTYRLAIHFKKNGRTRDDTQQVLSRWNIERNKPPLDDAELTKAVQSAFDPEHQNDSYGCDHQLIVPLCVKDACPVYRAAHRLDPRAVVDEMLKTAETDAHSAVGEALGRKEAIEALASLRHTERHTFEHLLMQLRERGALAREVDALKSAVGKVKHVRFAADAATAHDGDAHHEFARIDASLNAPVPADLLIPHDARVTERGVAVERGGNGDHPPMLEVIAPTPVLLSARYVDAEEGGESVELVWKRDGRWCSHVAPRRTIADAHEILGLATFGFPVTSLTSRLLVEYLTNLEQINLRILPRVRMTRRLGWHDDQSVFLWGESHVDANGITTPNRAEQANVLRFHPDDPGIAHLVSGFRANGDFQRWTDAIAPVLEFGAVVVGILTSLSTPLLQIVNAPNPILDFCGNTSKGKTTALRTGASVWGNPDETTGSSIVRTWDSTRVFVERLGATYHSLPLFLDETSMAPGQGRLVAQFVYQVSSGQGRGRGSPRGVRPSGNWKTGLLTTGEQPLTSFAEGFGGTYARVLTLWGSPFGETVRATTVETLNAAVLDHYGHAGPKFVHYLLQHRTRWSEFRSSYRETVENYQASARNSVASRLARTVAALDLTAKLASKDAAGVLPWQYAEMATAVGATWDAATTNAGDADRSLEALQKVISWSRRNRERFADGDCKSTVAPPQGWAGRWDRGPEWTHIWIFPDLLEHELEGWGFSPRAILNAWRDAKRLDTHAEGRLRSQVRFQGERARMYAIPRAAVDAIEPDESTDG
jgi:hypothetical protein